MSSPDEIRRREAARDGEHVVNPDYGHEVAPRSIPSHMDHSNCVDPKECERYEFYAAAIDNPDEWWDHPLPKKRSEKRQKHAMMSFRLNSDELKQIEWAAKARSMTISAFIRECALKTARQPYVRLISTTHPVETFTA
jgi:hypothetical protein